MNPTIIMATKVVTVSAPNVTPPAPLTDASGWENFKEEMEMFFVVTKEKDTLVQRSTLLYQGGLELRRIWKTIQPTPDDTEDHFKKAVKLLDAYYLPQKNVTFERSKFRAAVQRTGQGFMEYITELKELKSGCDFENYTADSAIIDQFIEKCSSTRLRKQLLGTAELTLTKLTALARGEELSEKRAEVMETRRTNAIHEPVTIKQEPEEVYYSSNNNNNRGRGGQQRQGQKWNSPSAMYCYGCGSSNHTHGDERCKAKNLECHKCHIVGHTS